MSGWKFPQVKVPERLEKSHCTHNLAHLDEMFVKLHYIEEDKIFTGPMLFCSLNTKYKKKISITFCEKLDSRKEESSFLGES